MAGIRSKNTKPELIVRKALHRKGFRYRLHTKSIPGTPDLVLPKYNALVFIHGCFWHHHGCHLSKLPPEKKWQDKLLSNAKRDAKVTDELLEAGWRVATVWECALKGKSKLPIDDIIQSLSDWLKSDLKQIDIDGGTKG